VRCVLCAVCAVQWYPVGFYALSFIEFVCTIVVLQLMFSSDEVSFTTNSLVSRLSTQRDVRWAVVGVVVGAAVLQLLIGLWLIVRELRENALYYEYVQSIFLSEGLPLCLLLRRFNGFFFCVWCAVGCLCRLRWRSLCC
jgi:hypothetical protein